jgi:hypothetical protein
VHEPAEVVHQPSLDALWRQFRDAFRDGPSLAHLRCSVRTNPRRQSFGSWPPAWVGVASRRMGVVRNAVTIAVAMTSVVALLIACSTSDEPKQGASSAANVEGAENNKPAPVPDPPPRYKHIDTNNDVALPTSKDGGGTLQIKCGGREPYVCMMDDGTFRCSDIPCVPDCDRIGCLGGDICTPCEGGYRCLSPGDHC